MIISAESTKSVELFGTAVMDEDGVYRVSGGSYQQPVPSASMLPRSTDGQAIVNEDHRAVVTSNITAVQASSRIEQRVLMSNFDRVNDLTVDPSITSLDPANMVKQNPMVTLEEQRIAEKIRTQGGTICSSPQQPLPTGATRGGYQISEYTSMYDQPSYNSSSNGSGGYQFSEYKSIYDP